MEHIGGKRGRSDGNTDDNDNNNSQESKNTMKQFSKVSVNSSNNNDSSTTVNMFKEHNDDSPSWSSSSSSSPSSSLESAEQIAEPLQVKELQQFHNDLSEKEQQEQHEKMPNVSHELYDMDTEHTTVEQTSLSPSLAVSVNKVSEYTNCVVQELAKVNGNVISSLLSEWNNSQHPLQEMYKTQQEIMKYILSTQREHIKSILDLKHTTEVSDMQNKVIAILHEYFTSKESKLDNVANDSIISSSDCNISNIVSLLWNRLSTYLQGPLQFMQQQLTSEREYNNELAVHVHHFLMSAFDEVNRHATRALHAKLESTAKDVQLAKLQSAYSFEQAQSSKQTAELHAMQKIVNELSKEHERAEQNEANAVRYKNYMTNVERQLEFKSIIASHIDKDEELHELVNNATQRNSFIDDNDYNNTVNRASKVYKTEAAASIAAVERMRRYHSISEQQLTENTTPLIQRLTLQNNYNNNNNINGDRNDNIIISKDEKGAALRSTFDLNRWNAVKSAAPEFFALRLLTHANITLSELIDDWIAQEKRILRASCECNAIHDASMRVRHDALIVHQLYQSEKQRRERVEERLNHVLREHAEIGAFMNNNKNKSSNNKNMYYLMRQVENGERKDTINKVRQETVHGFDRNGEYATLQEVPLVMREMQSLQTECNAAKDDAVHLSVLLQLAREEVNNAQATNASLRDQIHDLKDKLKCCTVAQELDALRTDMNNKWRSLQNEYVDVQSQLRLMTSLAEERSKECEQVQMEMERCREENSKLREQLLQSNLTNKYGSSKNSGARHNSREEVIVEDYLHSMGNATQEVMNTIGTLNSRIAVSSAKLDRTWQEKEKQYTIFNEQLTKFMESCENCVQEFTSLAHPIYSNDSNPASQTFASSTTTNANNCRAFNIVNNEKEAVPESATYLQWCAREQIELLQSAFRHSVEFLASFVSHSLNERSLSTQVLLRDGQCANELQNELHAAQYNQANLQQQLKSALDLVERHHLHLVQDVLMHEITPHTEITESHMLQENSQLSEQMATLTTELEATRATSTSTLTELTKLTNLKEEMQNNLLDEQTRRTLSDLYVDKLTTLLQESYARERLLSAENVELHKKKEEMTTRVVAQSSDAARRMLVTQINGFETSSIHLTEQEQEQQHQQQPPEQTAATLQELLISFDEKLESISSALAKFNRSQETETDEKVTQNKGSMPMSEGAERSEESKNTIIISSSLEAMPIPSESELALQLSKGGMSTIVQLIRSVLVKAQLVQDAVETSALQTTLAIAASTAEMYGDGSKEGKNVVVNVNEDHENSEFSNEQRANVQQTSDQLSTDPAISTKIAAGIDNNNNNKNMEEEEEIERALQLTRLAKRVELLEHEITMVSAEKEAITTRLHNAEAHSAKAEENNRRMLDITKTLLEKQQRLIAENKTLKEQLTNATVQSNAMKETKNVDNEANVNVSNESDIVTAKDDDITNSKDEESGEENKNVNNAIEIIADNAAIEATTTNANEGIESINEITNIDQCADSSTNEEVQMTHNDDKNDNVSDVEENEQHHLTENVHKKILAGIKKKIAL